MYLKAEIYITDYNGELNKFKQEVSVALQNMLGVLDIHAKEINIEVGYWRKANQIHNWFVKNVQDGEDDCQKYDVSIEQLIELKTLCETIWENKDLKYIDEHLPPSKGVFFGSYDVDGYYYQDLIDTIAIVDKCIELNESEGAKKLWLSFSYRSSW